MSRWDLMPRTPIGRRAVLLAGIAAVLVVAAGAGLAWVIMMPTTSKVCTAAGSLDEVGAATPEAARVRWAADFSLDLDIEHPDGTSGAGRRVTARYILPGPEAGWADPDRTHLREIVTERGDDDVWRVVSANRCEEWTDT